MPYSSYPGVKKHVIARFEEMRSLAVRMQDLIDTIEAETNLTVNLVRSHVISIDVAAEFDDLDPDFHKAYPEGFRIIGPNSLAETDLVE